MNDTDGRYGVPELLLLYVYDAFVCMLSMFLVGTGMTLVKFSGLEKMTVLRLVFFFC